jgi:hypothetical protein
MLFAVIAVLVLVVAGVMVWVWRAPTVGSAAAARSNASPGRTIEETRAMAQAKRKEMMGSRQRQGAGDAQGEPAKPNTPP